MPLHLIHGPPNTGRTDAVEAAFKDVLNREPLLVVPGVDDIFGWERRLTSGAGAVVGGQVVHFGDLCAEIIARADVERLDQAGELQRLELVARAVRTANGDLAARMAGQPGIAEAVLELIDDFRAELVDPATLEAKLVEAGARRLGWLTDAYRTYTDLLAEHGLSDGPGEITRALGLLSPEWASRPLFIAGFDDMTRQQLELIRRLAVDRGADVTVALGYEAGNPGLELSNELMSELLEMKGATSVRETATRRGEVEVPHEQVLLDLEARFMRDTGAEDALPATDKVAVMRSSGLRNEAEAIGAEIARLVAGGVRPEKIAVAVSVPASNGPVIRDTLTRLGVPVALESETAVRETTVGAAILSILKAVRREAGPRPALEWLRSPIGPDHRTVDEVELESAANSDNSADAVIGRLRKAGAEDPAGWAELKAAIRDGEPVAGIVAKLATDMSRALLAADAAATPSAATVIETQAGTAIARAAGEIEEIRDRRGTGLDEIRAAIESGAVKLWSVPAAGTVRIASPYTLRAKRFEHLFMASQQEGGIHDMDRAGPFLSASDRAVIGMRERTDPEVQARYLFYSCLTVPTDGLWISCRTSDEAGKAEQPSPLVSAVEELFERDAEGRPAVERRGRTGSDIVFDPAEAPSLPEVARGLVVAGPSSRADLGEYAAGLEVSLEAASNIEESTRSLASLSPGPITAELAADPVFSATDIEAYAGCPYRWFIERQLSPVQFGPDPDYFTFGTLLHGVLESLYRRFPSQVPRPGTLPDWLAPLPEIVMEQAAQWNVRLDGDDPVATGQRVRARELITTYLKREASRPEPVHRPAELEYSFGTKSAQAPAVEVNGWKVRGKVDRIDLSPERDGDPAREAVVIDYKSGDVSRLTHLNSEKERRLQLQLYLHAARAAGYVPVAGLYVSLRANAGPSRGAYSEAVGAEMKARGASPDDAVADPTTDSGPGSGIDDFIERGLERADESVAKMLAGLLEHDPATCPDHLEHPAVPDRAPEEDPDRNGGPSWS